MARVKKLTVGVISLITFFLLTPLQAAYKFYTYLIGAASSETIAWSDVAYAKILSTAEEVLQTFFPDAEELTEDIQQLTEEQASKISEAARIPLEALLGRPFHFHVGLSQGKPLGYAARDSVPGKWGPIMYMILLDPEGSVSDVMVLEYKEKRGKPVAKKRFLKQFRGKSIEDRIRLRKDIRGVTGASISSRGMADGIRKMVHVFHELYLN